MTNEEIRVAVAESVGWKFKLINTLGGKVWQHCQTQQIAGVDIAATDPPHLPNYPEDLNAMHEVEKTLTADQARQYHNALGRIGTGWSWYRTARQRAEAYLRVKGQWKE